MMAETIVINAVLFCLSSVLVFSPSSLAQNPNTTGTLPYATCVGFPPQCSQKYVVNESGFTYDLSPFWDTVVSFGGDHGAIDNVCNTYMPIGDDCHIYFRSVTYTNGTVLIEKALYAPLPKSGASRAQGLPLPTGCESCVCDDYILGQPYPGSYVLYRCYLWGTCVSNFSQQDQLLGFSRTRDVTAEARKALMALFDAYNNDYVEMPNKLPSTCVAYVGTNPVLGAERIPCEYRITVP